MSIAIESHEPAITFQPSATPPESPQSPEARIRAGNRVNCIQVITECGSTISPAVIYAAFERFGQPMMDIIFKQAPSSFTAEVIATLIGRYDAAPRIANDLAPATVEDPQVKKAIAESADRTRELLARSQQE